jgi:uncharacterized glyoxalase superfamily metalloenzyme YdcJ
VRTMFSRALSRMYQKEVPQYGTLLDLVADTNAEVLHEQEGSGQKRSPDGVERLNVERHGAVRLGTAHELSTMRRLFAVMGMHPVGYYDLAAAGVPVHATAFRPTDERSLEHNPFRVFTSLLRLELIHDTALRETAARVLAGRTIFTPRCLELIAIAQRHGGLDAAEAPEFVAQALETFRWHSEATVDTPTYRRLRNAHPLIADVVCFKGPHINHLTPRVLDIDAAQAEMHRRGMRAKASIEGPPKRKRPILLRQTSFLALEERIRFVGADADGTHTARFGEIEQRGCALTRKGRALYDELLDEACAHERAGASRAAALEKAFVRFPDDDAALRRQGLAFFRYSLGEASRGARLPQAAATAQQLVEDGWLKAEPLVYEDFLPVSAAGIFRSNLGSEGQANYAGGGDRAAFEEALGAKVHDEFALYASAEAASLADCRAQLAAPRHPGLNTP